MITWACLAPFQRLFHTCISYLDVAEHIAVSFIVGLVIVYLLARLMWRIFG